LSQDPLRELLDLSAVHAFYVAMLEERLGHPVPPHEVKTEDPGMISVTLRRWLNLLDLAISPAMVRDALQKQPQREALEALLRIYIQGASALDHDRDKADFLATYLFRNPPAWHGKGRPANSETDDPQYVEDFADEIVITLGDFEAPQPPKEHQQLAQEFDFIRQEVDELRHFDQLTDSGLVQRVRDIKELLGASFYHPRVLARVASYNAYFGRRFDDLFRQATTHIKKYADNVQKEGGSTMSRVQGDVLVKNLTEVEEEEMLRQEYGRAQDGFRKVSRFKKAVDSKRPLHAPSPAAPAAPAPEIARRDVVAAAPAGAAPDTVGPLRSVAANIEENNIRSVLESIQNFTRAAKETGGMMVPLRKLNIGLSVAEAEAFRADFGGEKSFRSEYAGSLRLMIAIAARMQSELLEYIAKKDSAYLWKPHADALTYLMRAAQEALDASGKPLATAQERGLKDKVTAMTATQQKLRAQMEQCSKAMERAQ
jgi:hypothetical protein